MGPNAGLKTALNKMREMTVADGSIYHQYVPVVTDTTSIGEFGTPILENPDVKNEFIKYMVKMIIGTRIDIRRYANKLGFLEKETMPMGAVQQNVFVNPVKGRQFNVHDFAGLLNYYAADVKVTYSQINLDKQYPVTITREKMRDAFTSWANLNTFIDGIYTALYNGAEIDRFDFTRTLVANAFRENRVQYEKISAVTDQATANAMLVKARELYLNFQEPSVSYNAWNKVGGYGDAIKTFTPDSEIMIMVRNDILSKIDVLALAQAFNIDSAKMMGRIVGVSNFDIFNDDGEKIYDGSGIQAVICDRAWFDIQQQDFALDEFYNANNRCWNVYLNQVYKYNYSLFANAVVLSTSDPVVPATKIEAAKDSVSVEAGKKVVVPFTITPAETTFTVAASSSAQGKATAAIVGRTVEITGVDEGSATITITGSGSGGSNVTDTISVTVTAATSA